MQWISRVQPGQLPAIHSASYQHSAFVEELTESLSNQENSKKPIKRGYALLQLDMHWPDWSPAEEGLGSPPCV
jgi:hypothetical protein